MVSFLEDVIKELYNDQVDIGKSIYVLPSKRAGTFLKKVLSKKVGKTMISPDIYSIEEFVEKISGLSYATQTQQLFELYKSYLQVGTYEKESFESFLSWGQTLIQDINEIDRYLVDASSLLSGLAAIQEVNHWSHGDKKTSLMKNYLHFWNQLYHIYIAFNSNLLKNNLGHQGLVYRKASEKIQEYIDLEKRVHVFIGFNALNTSESTIIQAILNDSISKIYWDLDEYFLKDQLHDAGLFIRKHKTSWKHFEANPIKGISQHYNQNKDLRVIGTPKNIAQTKFVGDLIENIQKENPGQLKDTAIILGDESLLNPLLNSLPNTITSVNITMGQKLELSGIATFFLGFIELHIAKSNRGWFYKDFTAFVHNPFTAMLLKQYNINAGELISHIFLKNWVYISNKELSRFPEANQEAISRLFFNYETPTQFVEKCSTLIQILKIILEKENNYLALEQLYKIHTLFNQIKELTHEFEYLNSLKGLKVLFRQLIASETMDFQGDPLEGLQIMGMLESRNLDFETVILTSVNEGILPSGKSNNSFIPFDLKIEFGLPTYKEKDAVYTYHFYRLMQRAKNIYLIYNTEPDVLEGGEKSRLITQILTDENRTDVIEKIATPKIQDITISQKIVDKSPSLMELLYSYAHNGFSPSSLSNYIRNPIDFYKQNLLGIQDTEEVEENIAANTMGTIIHDTLEELYTPFMDKEIDRNQLIKAKESVESLVHKNFQKTYLDGAYDSGKNLIVFNVVIRYIHDFLDKEIMELLHHNVKIIGLEKKLNVQVSLPNVNRNVVLKGKLDRIDVFDGIIRIIDYKTGKVEKRHLEIVDWENLIASQDYSKAFQLLCYSYMFLSDNTIENINAGIFSIKNLKEGLILFSKKSSPRDTKKNPIINKEVVLEFEKLLHKLIEEILNPKIPFIEKEV
ncbi:hypothetical protein CJ263_08910 [Maribacter cobaltidurans]|uniref:Uncharacterized protein n=2 Tax=Maribacter cobaltidurans TaxID=1178778 RepID=A0A223VCS1_9FLAO|nr:hypothetical protein CJ263_08910 [Maribacter cobaltidurans]GGD77611.1 hypothetical protein GCM10011412_14300 [Maribacter cobaltidurans]